MSEIEDILASCTNSESGCFAGKPQALKGILYMDDALLRIQWGRVANAADTAGVDGTPLDDATFEPAVLAPSPGLGWPSSTYEIGSAEGMKIGDLERPVDENLNSTQGFDYAVAQCAYQCGKNSTTCPLKQKLTDPQEPNEARWEDSEDYKGSHLS